jgi:ABC-type transport system involved in cytochrome bd biosynthesis fused ATPase/permease subunit
VILNTVPGRAHGRAEQQGKRLAVPAPDILTLLVGRTAIVIAHRLSTVKRMDELIIMEHGVVAERGPHEALLARNGIYAALWAHQSGGFLGGPAS